MNMNNNIYSLYKKLYKKHGISPEAVKARDSEQQKNRFEYLLSCAQIKKNDSILDVGCGSGEMLSFLRKNKLKGFYCGVDFVDEFVEHANHAYKKDLKAKFIKMNITNEEFEESYDWVLLSGVFNDLREDSEVFLYSTIEKMFKASNKGIIFNSLTKYVDYEDENLFYSYPDQVIKYCFENLSKYIVLSTNYQLKENTIPFEYSLCVYKK